MVIAAFPSVLQSGHAIGPFALSLYLLAIGAGLFKPNISPTVLDQNPHLKPHVITEKSGKKVIVDPEATSESIMLVSCFSKVELSLLTIAVVVLPFD